MFFRFPPDARWNAERASVEFGIGEVIGVQPGCRLCSAIATTRSGEDRLPQVLPGGP